MELGNKSVISPMAFFTTLHQHKDLVVALTTREIFSRYKGSFMGIFWSFITPLLMLAVYTFVFGVVFRARWSGENSSQPEFALILFSGLLVYNVFSECINRAPTLIVANANYVKKILFPLEIIPIATIGAALFNMGITLCVWLMFYLVIFGVPHLTILLLPVAILPLVLLTLGLTWFLASVGVYVRDVNQLVGILTTVLLFLSPIFYPLSALPESYQHLVKLSPFTYAIEQARDIMIWGRGMDWAAWFVWTVLSSGVAWLGYAWFQKTRKGFSDVL